MLITVTEIIMEETDKDKLHDRQGQIWEHRFTVVWQLAFSVHGHWAHSEKTGTNLYGSLCDFSPRPTRLPMTVVTLFGVLRLYYHLLATFTCHYREAYLNYVKDSFLLAWLCISVLLCYYYHVLEVICDTSKAHKLVIKKKEMKCAIPKISYFE